MNSVPDAGTADTPRPKTSPLRVLPPEILFKICEEVVGADGDTASLARLGRSCRGFSQIATSVLYREIKSRVIPAQGVVLIQSIAVNNLGKNMSLLLTLCSNPTLGAAIRSMELAPASVGFHLLQTAFPMSTLRTYHAAIHQMFGVSPAQNGSFHNPVTPMALACQAPNLVKLQLTIDTTWKDTDFLLNKNNNRVTGPKFTLHHLAELTIDYNRRTHIPDKGLGLRKLNGVFHTTPNLKKLTIDRARGGTSLTARLPHLTTLKLTNTHLCPGGLHHLTRACPNLVHFEFTHDPDTAVAVRPRHPLPVSPAQILTCLVKPTLQRLAIAPWLPPQQQHLTQAQYPLLSPQQHQLSAFTSLRQVAVDYRAIAIARAPNDGSEFQALVGLFQGMEQLEGVFLFGVQGSERFGKEFGVFLQRVIRTAEWPRLRVVRLQARRVGGGDVVRERGVWERLESCLENGSGSDMRLVGVGRGVVVEGVRVVALPGWVVTGPFGE
ncbi:hypothetical protein C8A00DRAFT_31382 [Chaetomidium leptoderma]|uniref:F-box domain-containing protein n=1 Tax=Chaetomidium leptoderma TaxID=669021 RepID=A0AAN6ZZB5_9PEZI|nr:hypothetical protein C8A00DRAFT_31382 [Chaetomidium leptoderma]